MIQCLVLLFDDIFVPPTDGGNDHISPTASSLEVQQKSLASEV